MYIITILGSLDLEKGDQGDHQALNKISMVILYEGR